MALTDNLAAYWKLDNALTDEVNSNTLTNINAVNINAAGIINQGADFENTSSQYLYCEDSASLSITGDISISLWFKYESHVANLAWIGKADRTDRDPWDWKIWWETDNSLIFQWSSDGSFVGTRSRFTCPFTPSDGTWYHIVATADVSVPTGIVYIGGSAQGMTTVLSAATSISDSNVQTMLGTDGSGNYLDGILDEVGIWSRILTSDEVTTLYNGGAGIQYPFGGGTAATIIRPRRMMMGIGI